MRTVRAASKADLPLLLKMIKSFHGEVGACYPYQEARVAAFVAESIIHPSCLAIVVGEPRCGFLIARKGTNYLTGESFAEEVALWVEPDCRAYGYASHLLDEFEAWGSDCDVIKLTLQHSYKPDQISALYRKRGYQPSETAFIRRA